MVAQPNLIIQPTAYSPLPFCMGLPEVIQQMVSDVKRRKTEVSAGSEVVNHPMIGGIS